MKYYSPKRSIVRWIPLLFVALFFSYLFLKLAFEEGSVLVVVFALPLIVFGLWLGKILHLRISKPSIEVQLDSVIVQNKFGRFLEVAPATSYQLIFSKDFFAFRKGKENDITVEMEHIRKNEFPNLKKQLIALPFQNP